MRRGQNALYLAQKGHCVDAFDLSEYAIEKLKHRSELLHAPVNASAADLTAYSFEKRYDVIPCFGTLHFVEREDWKRFLLRAKENTRTGGIHIMQIFGHGAGLCGHCALCRRPGEGGRASGAV